MRRSRLIVKPSLYASQSRSILQIETTVLSYVKETLGRYLFTKKAIGRIALVEEQRKLHLARYLQTHNIKLYTRSTYIQNYYNAQSAGLPFYAKCRNYAECKLVPKLSVVMQVTMVS